MNPSDELRSRRISLPLSTARLAVVALVLAAIGMPVAWASASFPSSSAQVVLAPTPVFLNETGSTGVFDTDDSPVLCQTESYTPASESTARMDSWVNVGEPGSPVAFLVRNAISENGGGTWQNADLVASAGVSHAISGGPSDPGFAGNSAIVALTAGTTYVFGVRVGGIGGQPSVPGGTCEVLVEITQDPGSPEPTDPIEIPGDPPGPGPLP